MTEALNYLFSLEQHGIKLGLDNIGLLCDALGHPERSFQSVIVAGTNGKGSVAAMVETALRVTGLRTGRFNSPHLIHLAERFVVNGEPISREDLSLLAARLQATILDLCASGRLQAPPTFFEATTAIAFMAYQRADVQVAVLEVGMGGRFDATNIVTPVAAVITSVDIDHEQFLGRTLSAIAFEKAGVIKPGGVIITGETKQPALDVLRQASRERGAYLVEAAQGVTTAVTLREGLTDLELTTPRGTYGPLTLSLRGRHQVSNAVVAVRVLEQLEAPIPVPESAIEAALTKTRWSGRLELLRISDTRSVLLDAAHNVAAATALGLYLAEVHPEGVPLVLAAMRDKDVAGIVRVLEPRITHIICTSLRSHRAWPGEGLAEIVMAACPALPCSVADSPSSALDEGWEDGPVVCAAGSVYLVGELLDLVGSLTRNARAPG